VEDNFSWRVAKMGVKGLWKLLRPVGRTVNLDTLANKRLAIDASIWLTQFVKAMRDAEGGLSKNAHLLGMLRRILKLLYYGIKPVFVFDGARPLIKRKTLAQRQKLRKKAENSLQGVARKLLLNQLKMRSLPKALIENQSKLVPTVATERQQHRSSQVDKKSHAVSLFDDEVAVDETEHEPEKEEEKRASDSDAASNDDNDTPSWHRLRKRKWRWKHSKQRDGPLSRKRSKTSTDEQTDDDAEFEIPPEAASDPQVMASLPMTMQLEIRERKAVAEQYQTRKTLIRASNTDPDAFSTLQVSRFLKSCAFNSEINSIRKTMQLESFSLPDALGGGQALPIISDSNTRYVFRKATTDKSTSKAKSHKKSPRKVKSLPNAHASSDQSLSRLEERQCALISSEQEVVWTCSECCFTNALQSPQVRGTQLKCGVCNSFTYVPPSVSFHAGAGAELQHEHSAKAAWDETHEFDAEDEGQVSMLLDPNFGLGPLRPLDFSLDPLATKGQYVQSTSGCHGLLLPCHLCILGK
jgi:DNA excision repair protein ERCC-5